MQTFLIILILIFTCPLIGQAQINTKPTVMPTNTIESSEYDSDDEFIDEPEILQEEEEFIDDTDSEDSDQNEPMIHKVTKEQEPEPTEETQESDGLTKAQKEKLKVEQIKNQITSESIKAKEKQAKKDKEIKPKHDWRFKDPSKRKEATPTP